MTTAVLYILISVLGGVAGQLLLKRGMNAMGPVTLGLGQLAGILWRMATNPWVFMGLAIYLGSTVYWLAALSRVDLSYAYPFASISYALMLLGSWILFDEKITVFRIIGTAVIGIGIFFIYRD